MSTTTQKHEAAQAYSVTPFGRSHIKCTAFIAGATWQEQQAVLNPLVVGRIVRAIFQLLQRDVEMNPATAAKAARIITDGLAPEVDSRYVTGEGVIKAFPTKLSGIDQAVADCIQYVMLHVGSNDGFNDWMRASFSGIIARTCVGKETVAVETACVVSKQQAEIDELKAEVARLRALGSQYAEINRKLAADLASTQHSLQRSESDLKGVMRSACYAAVAALRQRNAEQAEVITKQTVDLANLREELTAKLATKETISDCLKEDLDIAKAELAHLKALHAQQRVYIEDYQSQIATLTKQRDGYDTDRQEMRVLAKKHFERVGVLEQALHDVAVERNEARAQLIRARQDIEWFAKEKAQLEARNRNQAETIGYYQRTDTGALVAINEQLNTDLKVAKARADNLQAELEAAEMELRFSRDTNKGLLETVRERNEALVESRARVAELDAAIRIHVMLSLQ